MICISVIIRALQKIYNAGFCYLLRYNIMSSVQNKIHGFGNTSINLWVRHNLDKLLFYNEHKKGMKPDILQRQALRMSSYRVHPMTT